MKEKKKEEKLNIQRTNVKNTFILIGITIVLLFTFLIVKEITDINITVDDNALIVFKEKMKENQEFRCNEYSSPYVECENNKKFMNSTGLYCNGRLVCQNGLYEHLIEYKCETTK